MSGSPPPADPELSGARAPDAAAGAEPTLPGAVLSAALQGLQSSDPEVRLRAMATLGDMGPDAAIAVEPLVAALLRADDSIRHFAGSVETRECAARALVRIGAAAVPALLDELPENTNQSSAAIAVLTRLGNGASPDGDPMLRLAALAPESLRWTGLPERGRWRPRRRERPRAVYLDTVPTMPADLLTHARVDVRLAALRLLGSDERRWADVPDELLAASELASDARVRLAMVMAVSFAKGRTEKRDEILRRALRDPDPVVRFRAAEADCYDDQALDVLLEGLADRTLRLDAITTFAFLHRAGLDVARALPALLAALQMEEEELNRPPSPEELVFLTSIGFEIGGRSWSEIMEEGTGLLSKMAPDSPQVGAFLIRLLPTSPCYADREDVVDCMGRLTGANIGPAVAALMEYLADAENPRLDPVIALAEFGAAARVAVPLLLSRFAALLPSAAVVVDGACAEVGGEVRESASAELDAWDVKRQRDFIHALIKIGGDEVETALASRKHDANVRAAVVYALSRTAPQDSATLEAIIAGCADPVPSVRAVAAEAFGQVASADVLTCEGTGSASACAVSTLLDAIAAEFPLESDVSIRYRREARRRFDAAIKALAKIAFADAGLRGSGASVSPAGEELLRALRTGVPVRRLAAARALKEAGFASPELHVALNEILAGEPDPSVREAAEALLAELDSQARIVEA